MGGGDVLRPQTREWADRGVDDEIDLRSLGLPAPVGEVELAHLEIAPVAPGTAEKLDDGERVVPVDRQDQLLVGERIPGEKDAALVVGLELEIGIAVDLQPVKARPPIRFALSRSPVDANHPVRKDRAIRGSDPQIALGRQVVEKHTGIQRLVVVALRRSVAGNSVEGDGAVAVDVPPTRIHQPVLGSGVVDTETVGRRPRREPDLVVPCQVPGVDVDQVACVAELVNQGVVEQRPVIPIGDPGRREGRETPLNVDGAVIGIGI